MPDQRTFGTFEQIVLPHLDAAYNLARWLTRREHDAQDVVQEAYMRAFKAFDQFHGGDARCWLLAVVRNTCYTWLQRNRPPGPVLSYDEQLHDAASSDADPELILQKWEDAETLRQTIEELPPEFREVLILRELEGLSYQEIATVADLPVGTVMSRLSRARTRLEHLMRAHTLKEARA